MRFSRRKNIDKQKTDANNDSKKIFVDREQYTKTFNFHLLEAEIPAISKNGMLLTYSGVGGVGKSALLKQFEEIAKDKGKKFIYYDFKSGHTEMLQVLKDLRKKLCDDYDVEFPLFDKGCIYLAQKSGDFVTSEQQKVVLESSSLLRSFKKNFFKIGNANERMTGVAKIAKPFLEDTDDDILEFFQALAQGTLEANPALKFVKPMLDLIDKKQARHEEEARKEGNEDYKAVADELENLNEESNSAFIEEFLPTLFAQDLSFWLEKNNTDLIIFLDTYEKLTGEESGKKKTVHLISEDNELVPVDWWVGELLLTAGRVMWVIAGRYEINEIGDADLERGRVKNYTLDPLDKNSANEYLDKLNVKENHIREKIIEVTGGLPYYIHLCCNVTYKNKFLKGEEPDFGENLEKVVERAIGSFDENSRALLQKLCILGRWTGDIFRAVIPDHNPNVYKRLKSILVEESFADFSYGEQEKIYSFDRTIGSFLLPSLKEDKDFSNYFTDIRDKANAYFEKLFSEYLSYDESKFYFVMWSDIVLRTTDKPAELMTFYEENFVLLENHFDRSTWATVIQKFLDKIGDKEPLPQAYFQDRLGRIRFYQYRIKEALELSEAAYSEVKDLPLSNTERPFKLSIMRGLAEVFQRLERYTDEISLCKEMISECERYLPNDIDSIVAAKNTLADALEMCDRIDDAIEIWRQIVEALDGRDDKRYIDAADNLATVLELWQDNESALPLRRKIVALYEKNNDEYVLARLPLDNLIYTLKKFSDKEHLEERAACYRRLLTIREKRGDDTSYLLEDFLETLQKLGLDDEAAQISEKIVANSAREAEDLQRRIDDLQRLIESVDTPNAKNVELMIDRFNLMWDANADETEKDNWKEKINETIRAIIERTCREPVADYDAAIETLNDLIDLWWGCEDIALRRNILALTEKKSDATVEELIDAKKDFAQELYWKEDLTDADKAEVDRLFEELENYYRQNLPASYGDLLDTLNNHAYFFDWKLKNIPAAVEKRKEILALLESDSETPADKILSVLKEIARMFGGDFSTTNNYSEEFIWRKRILNFCREHFVEDAPETLKALEHLIHACDNLNDRDAAERYRQQLIAAKEKNLGSSHIEVIKIKEQLADILHEANKSDDEIALREQIVELYRENFRANPTNKKKGTFFRAPLWKDFIQALKNLADCLDKTGQTKKAVAVRKQLISENKESLQGDLDAWTIEWTIECLIRDLQRVGDYDEELRYRRELVDFYRAEDSKSYNTRYAMEKLAEAYSRYDKEDEAVKVYKQIAENFGLETD